MLDVLLALDRIPDVGMTLCIDEALQPISLAETFGDFLAVFPGPLREIARYADVQDAIGSVRHEIDPSTMHPKSFACASSGCSGRIDGRVEPGHVEFGLG
jgi:hypothetical protein